MNSHFDHRQIPLIVRGQETQQNHNRKSRQHARKPQSRQIILEKSGRDRPSDRSDRVNMLAEDIRHLIRKDVPQRAAANAGCESEERNQEDVVTVSLINPHHNAVHREGREAERVKPEQYLVIDRDDRLRYRPLPAHYQKDNVRRQARHHDINRVPEHSRREPPDDDIPQHSAARGRADREHIDAEDIHALPDAGQRSRNREGNRSDHIQNCQQ